MVVAKMHDKGLCPKFEVAFAIIAKKWNGLLIRVLLDGPKRFSEIRSFIPELSDKVLADKLKDLERLNIVNRVDYVKTPVLVEYSLTEKGKALKPVLDEIQRWAGEWE